MPILYGALCVWMSCHVTCGGEWHQHGGSTNLHQPQEILSSFTCMDGASRHDRQKWRIPPTLTGHRWKTLTICVCYHGGPLDQWCTHIFTHTHTHVHTHILVWHYPLWSTASNDTVWQITIGSAWWWSIKKKKEKRKRHLRWSLTLRDLGKMEMWHRGVKKTNT